MNKEQNRFALETDARSRVAIYLINRANSKSIGQFGGLTHDPFHVDGGFISGDGQVRVSGDASYVSFKPTSIQYSDYILDPSTWSWVPAPGAMVIPPELCERINQVSPYQIPTLLTNLTGQNDFVFLARALRLDKLDFDNIHGPMTRAFAENTPSASIPKDCTPLPILDHDGFFVRMNVFCNDAVFDFKTFQHHAFGICSFLFTPKHPGVWFNTPDARPPAGDIVIDTRISDILNGRSPANAGLIVAENIASFDWAVLFGRNVFYVWRPGEFQSRNTFAAALRFIAEAKKHGIEISILKFDPATSAQDILARPAIIKQATDYAIPLPAALKKTEYVDCSLPQDDFIPCDIPVFWQNGGCTLFYGPGNTAVLRKLLQTFERIRRDEYDNVLVSHGTDMQDGVSQKYVFPKKTVGLLYPPSASTRIINLVRNAKAAIPRISSAILHEEDADALEMALSQNGIDVLFIAYADELPEKELAAVLDSCGRTGVVVGVFSSSEVVPSGIVMELVSQHFAVNAENANAGSVFVKDMKSKKVKKYIFGDDGKVSAVESDEDNINNPKQ